jgi:myo-inositol 2-dehydrogenase/D-chiro-inositol 1-dehydrogenase
MIRIGWIGCGTHAGEMLLSQLVRLDARLEALCDIDADWLARIAGHYGIGACYTDLAALLASGVGRDRDGGRSGTARCAGSRRSGARPAGVPGEAPAPTAADAARLAAAAQRSGRPCVVGFMKRYSTANRIASNILRSAAFGLRVSLLGEYMTVPTYFAGNPDHTGFYLHHCVHAMDMVPWLLGDPVVSIQARRFEPDPGRLRCTRRSASLPAYWRRSCWAPTSPAARQWSGGR